MNTCSLCLEIETSVSKLGDSEASKHLQEILSKHGFETLDENSDICYLCKYLLNKYFSFIKRILRAQVVLKDVLNKGSKKISYARLKFFDRAKLKLNHNLSVHNVECFNQKIQDDNIVCQKEGIVSEVCSKDIKEEIKDNSSEPDLELGFADFNEINNESDIKYELTFVKYEKKETVKPTKKRDRRYIPRPIELMPTKLRSKTKQTNRKNSWVESDQSDNENADDEYIPVHIESKSESSDTEVLYDDNGKPIKKDNKKNYPMECAECDAEIVSRKEHYRHYVNYHKDKKYPFKQEHKFVCPHCGVTRSKKEHLHRHELTHGKRTVECVECGKKFFSLYDMKRHARTHRKEHSYICDYCNKGFHFKSDLGIHIRIHTGEKPFKCHICGAGFAHKGNIGVHIRNIHQKYPAALKKSKSKSETSYKNTSKKGRRKGTKL